MAFKKIAVLVILMTMFVCCTVAKDSPEDKADPEEEVKCTEEEVKAMNFLNSLLQKGEK